MSYIDEIKTWFMRGKKPTQPQFWYWLEKTYFRDQTIPVDKVSIGETVLSSGATINWDFEAHGSNASVTLGQNATLAVTNMQLGQFGMLVVKQDGTGGRTITLPAGTKVGNSGAGVVTLSSAADAIDTLGIYKSTYGLLLVFIRTYS